MDKVRLILFAFFLLAFDSGCGRKGQLLEPVPKIPQPVRDFRVVQKGDNLIFNWTNPSSYLNGDPLSLSLVEIKGLEVKDKGPAEGQPIKFFNKYSKPLTEMNIGRLALGKEKAVLKLDLLSTIGKNYLFGLKTRGQRGGWSEVSNLVEVKPQLLPLPPQKLQAELFEDRIVLSWQAPVYCLDRKTVPEKLWFNVYRSQSGDFKRLNSSPLSEPRFEDRSFAFGLNYRYLVTALSGEVGVDGTGESEDSEVLEITPADIFPPKAPAEIKSMVSEQEVSLSWLPNQEADLAGYRVYRLKEGEERERLLTPELLTVPVFLDQKVEKNCFYVYSIRAVDIHGNEGPSARIQVKT